MSFLILNEKRNNSNVTFFPKTPILCAVDNMTYQCEQLKTYHEQSSAAQQLSHDIPLPLTKGKTK